MNSVLKSQKLLKIWRLLDHAVKERTAYSLMQLATVSMTRAPKIRTVIIRGFDKEKGIISFVTDFRSQKVCEIINNPRVSLTTLDHENGQQLRIEGTAEIISVEDARQKAWDRLSGLYHDADSFSPVPVQNFCLIDVKIEQLDWLEFRSEPQVRDIYIKVEKEWISYCLKTAPFSRRPRLIEPRTDVTRTRRF